MRSDVWQPNPSPEAATAVTNGAAAKATNGSPPSSVTPSVHSSSRFVLSSRSRYLHDGVLPGLYQMRICQAYLAAGGDPFNDCYISPLRTPLPMLARFPPVFIHVGEVDPLLDDSVGFMRRVREAKGLKDGEVAADGWRGELLIIPRVSHAYLHVSGMLKEGKEAIAQSEAWIREILTSEERPEKETGKVAPVGKRVLMPV